MKKTRCFYLFVSTVGILSLGWSFAVAAPPTPVKPNPCTEDIAKFCPNLPAGPAGVNALMNCLETHEKELSKACQDYEAKMWGPRMESREAVRARRAYVQSCRSDMVKFCKDAGIGPGSVFNCLSQHESELSTPCQESIKAIKMR